MKIGNKTYETVTLELLKKLDACEDGVDFFRRNKLEGFPLNRLHEIEGDYNGFVSWLKETLKVAEEWEYDQKGNLTQEMSCDGRVWKYEYDQNGNRIKEMSCDGRVWKFEYDQNGNLTKEVDWESDATKYEYDQNGNKTKEVFYDGDVIKYEYDQNGNEANLVNSKGSIWKSESSFYSDSQLKSYGGLKIPFFEKPLENA